MTTCAVSITRTTDPDTHFARAHTTPRETARASFRVPGLGRDFEVKIATKQSEFAEAYELLADNYRARGYDCPGNKAYRFTRFHALPETVTLVAKHEDRVVATLSLVPDTDLLGLPMESIYGPEIAQMRQEGRAMAEAISLADSGLSIREFVQVFKSLIKLAMQYHFRRGGDTWVITINPRHRSFYQKVLGFAPLGPQRSYPTVQNHPAEAFLLDLDLMAANAPQMYKEVFGDQLPEDVLTAARWTAERVRYFASRSTQIDDEALEDLLVDLPGLRTRSDDQQLFDLASHQTVFKAVGVRRPAAG